jgi:hypothetical protein
LYEKQQRERSAASFLAQVAFACEQIGQTPPAWGAIQDHFARLGKSHTGSRAPLPEIQEFGTTHAHTRTQHTTCDVLDVRLTHLHTGKVMMLMINEALGNLYTQQAPSPSSHRALKAVAHHNTHHRTRTHRTYDV